MSERPSGSSEVRTYPRDEFDDLTPGEGRRGAHRARPNPAFAMLPLVLVVVLVVAAVVGAITVLGGEEPEAAPAATAAPTEAATPGPTAAATDAPTTGAPTTTTTPSAAPTGVVDADAPITVLNGTRTSGLATGATEMLQEQGWNVVEAGNYREGDTPPTTVFYPTGELATTAEAVAEDLGGAATDLTDAFGGEGLTVVLGEDYQP